jgi:polysaccharide biosynthesis transport protein
MTPAGFDVRYILNIVRRRFPLFALPFAVVMVLGTIVIMSLNATYTANAKLLVESQQIPEDLVKSTVTAEAPERIQVIQQRVMTRENILALVDKFKLFENRKDLSRSEVVDEMRKRIVFAQIDVARINTGRRNEKMTTAFSIEFSHERPETAMRVASDIVTFIVEADVKSRTERASDTTKFLARETERLTTSITEIQNKLSEFKLQNSASLPEKLAFNMTLLERTERGIADLQRELIANEEQQRLVSLEAAVKQAGATDLYNPQNAIRKRLAEAKADYEVRAQTLAERHPDMRAMRKAIAALETELRKTPEIDESQVAVLTPQAQLYQERVETLKKAAEVMVEQQAKLEDDANRLRAIVARTPETGNELSGMERKAETLQKSLDDMASRYDQARLGERLEQDQRSEKFQVIEQPVMPQSPSSPNRPALLGAVLAAALGLGAAFPAAAEFLDSTIRRSADIERQLRQRALVVIPYIRTRLEERRKGRQLRYLLAGSFGSLVMFLLAMHVFYRPLDEIGYKILGGALMVWG